MGQKPEGLVQSNWVHSAFKLHAVYATNTQVRFAESTAFLSRVEIGPLGALHWLWIHLTLGLQGLGSLWLYVKGQLLLPKHSNRTGVAGLG